MLPIFEISAAPHFPQPLKAGYVNEAVSSLAGEDSDTAEGYDEIFVCFSAAN